MVELKNIPKHLPDNIHIYAKLERFNPGGSVKDRPALRMIQVVLPVVYSPTTKPFWIQLQATLVSHWQ